MISPDEYAAKYPSEAGQQTALFMWAALPEVRAKYPQLEYMFAIPNGGTRHKAEAARLKASGVKAGVPDIFLAAPHIWQFTHPGHVSHGLFIELKKQNGHVRVIQSKWMVGLMQQGYAARICYSFAEARDTIINYFEG